MHKLHLAFQIFTIRKGGHWSGTKTTIVGFKFSKTKRKMDTKFNLVTNISHGQILACSGIVLW